MSDLQYYYYLMCHPPKETKEEKKQRYSSKVIFLRDPSYMKRATTRRKMFFYDPSGKEIAHIVHVFPVLEYAVAQFKEENDGDWEIVSPPNGWKIYALQWDKVQEFVAQTRRSFLLDFFGPSQSDTPPQPLKFKKKYSASIKWKWIRCWCGCERGYWERRVDIRYQAVFSPVPISYIKGLTPEQCAIKLQRKKLLTLLSSLLSRKRFSSLTQG
jgi:hypothetical protein